MKAILEFDLDKEDSDDRAHFEDAVNGTKWKLFAWQFDQWLRSQTKYASDATHEEYVKALYDARDKFHEMLGEDSLKLD
jgi:hypothetical protein